MCISMAVTLSLKTMLKGIIEESKNEHRIYREEIWYLIKNKDKSCPEELKLRF